MIKTVLFSTDIPIHSENLIRIKQVWQGLAYWVAQSNSTESSEGYKRVV